MEAEEILSRLLDNNPELAKTIESLKTNSKKKRGRPKKTESKQKEDDNGIFIPNNKAVRRSSIDPNKTLTKAEPVDLSKIKNGKNSFKESSSEKDDYYKERPNEKKMYKSKPIERTRKSNLVTKECQECHKTVQLSAILAAADYFRCDDCLINKGRKS